MKHLPILFAVMFSTFAAKADPLPTITGQPQSLTVRTTSNAVFSVIASGATSYQWRFNGTDLAGATAATLVVTNAQTANVGYYMAVAKNDTGWVPSQMAYLSVVNGAGGLVPFENYDSTNSQAKSQCSGTPINVGTVRAVAGPQLDQMQPVDFPVSMDGDGYFDGGYVVVPTVPSGQQVYYRILITNACFSNPTFTQPSATLILTAGTNGVPLPSTSALRFPYWLEWPNPVFNIDGQSSPKNQVYRPGENANIKVTYYDFYGPGSIQWRKDGQDIPGATNSLLTITNIQSADTGVYDARVFSSDRAISPKFTIQVQSLNGQTVLQSPRIEDPFFVCDLAGLAGRYYTIEWTTNLTDWNSLLTLTNTTGTTTFSNALSSGTSRSYRAKLLP
jgi:hypothetical protein